jgi:hypothetical protein
MPPGGRRIGAGRPVGSGNKAPPELREIARAHSDKAFGRVLQLIDSKDERVALMASNTVLDRAWGKAEAREEVAVVRAFAVVPQVMSEEDWLRTRGNPNLLGRPGDPDLRQEWRGASLEAPAKSVQTLTPCLPIDRS